MAVKGPGSGVCPSGFEPQVLLNHVPLDRLMNSRSQFSHL